ncbi:hypothetical protein [Chryseobacterium culicis]|uniref:hypothetical protein n=1 Tax=Chryseobacterium culicis TaxID=680127 RepID=UPI0018749034|nr:hypothetical protein [Chryseobacterium culicis]MBE4948031.1 hypothetical protein [Chryseobacterium culicis]
MTKTYYLKEFQKRLPEDIKLIDETSYDFTEDEIVSIFCWLKYFNYHYETNGKKEYPKITFPIVSKRLRLDFGLYIPKNDMEPYKGQHNIYISENGKLLTGKVEKQSLEKLIKIWKL